MRILNLTDQDLPKLQGVAHVGTDTADKCRKALGEPANTAAGAIRSHVQAEAFLAQFKRGDVSLIRALHEQQPVLVVLDRDDVARHVLDMQIGPEPGTTIPLLVPVEAKNRRWFYLGSDSDLPMEVAFQVDQNGNIAGLANFVHRTPELTGGEIVFKRWKCAACGLVYDETRGWPDEGIPPFTRWKDVPDDWKCPDCGAAKSSFAMEEVE